MDSPHRPMGWLSRGSKWNLHQATEKNHHQYTLRGEHREVGSGLLCSLAMGNCSHVTMRCGEESDSTDDTECMAAVESTCVKKRVLTDRVVWHFSLFMAVSCGGHTFIAPNHSCCGGF